MPSLLEENSKCHTQSPHLTQHLTWGLYYEARFGVSEVTSGSTPGFLYYEGGSLVIGVDRHGNIC